MTFQRVGYRTAGFEATRTATRPRLFLRCQLLKVYTVPSASAGGATVAVIFTVVRLVRSGVGASAWAQSAVVATASLAIVYARVDWRLAARAAWRDH